MTVFKFIAEGLLVHRDT